MSPPTPPRRSPPLLLLVLLCFLAARPAHAAGRGLKQVAVVTYPRAVVGGYYGGYGLGSYYGGGGYLPFAGPCASPCGGGGGGVFAGPCASPCGGAVAVGCATGCGVGYGGGFFPTFGRRRLLKKEN
jgi:hypothetical protein